MPRVSDPANTVTVTVNDTTSYQQVSKIVLVYLASYLLPWHILNRLMEACPTVDSSTGRGRLPQTACTVHTLLASTSIANIILRNSKPPKPTFMRPFKVPNERMTPSNVVLPSQNQQNRHFCNRTTRRFSC